MQYSRDALFMPFLAKENYPLLRSPAATPLIDI